MPTTEDEAGRPKIEAAGVIERMQAEIGKLKSQIGVVLEKVSPWGEDAPGSIITGFDPGVSGSTGHMVAGASKAEETESNLTSDDLNEVFREALKLIDANGLDTPEGHLEFVRRQLRAAVS